MSTARSFVFVLGNLAALLACFNGCSKPQPATGGTGATSPADQSQLTIAVIPKSTGGEFWETVEQGARQAAQQLGVTLKWEGTLTETEIAEQNKIIENMINLGVDGMALAPLNRKAMRKSVQNAVDAGIPVVVFDSAVDGDAHVSFVATNNEQGGVLGAEHMLELLGEKQGDFLVLRFVQGTGSTEARAKGFMETVEAAGMRVAADPYPEDGTVAGAKKAASNTLEAFIKGDRLELDGIFACNLVAALGMAAALDDLRKSGIEVESYFVGFDTSPKLLEGLQQGKIDALVVQNPRKMGKLAVQTIVRHLRGEPIEALIDTGVELVTKERLDRDPAIRQLVGLE